MHDDPDDATGSDSLWLRRALVQGGSLEAMRNALQRAFLSVESYSRFSDDIAHSLEARGLADDVLLILKRKCQLSPDDRRPVLQLARALARRADPSKHEEALVWAHEIETNDDGQRLDLAQMLEGAGRYDLAIAELSATDAYARRDLTILRKLARLYGLAGATTECVQLWRIVVSISGNRVQTDDLTALGIALSQANSHEDAIEVLNRVLRMRPEAGTRANIGMALIQAGQPQDAILCFERGLAEHPNSLQARFGLGVALRMTGRIREAVDQLRVVTEQAPDWEVGFLELGVAMRSMGQHRAAKASLLRAAMLAPEDAGIQAELRTSLQDDPKGPETEHRTGMSSITGTLTSFPLEDILEFLRFQRLSGMLVLNSQGRGEGRVRLHRGRLVSARAPGRHTKTEGPTGARAALQALQSWREGQFSFHRVDPDPGNEPAVTLDLAELLLEIARKQDEKGRT